MTTEELENLLHLKQLQINGLLNISQAINNNIPRKELFKMFSSFLGWELAVKKMALFFQTDEKWVCEAHFGIDAHLVQSNLPDFSQYTRLKSLESQNSHPLFEPFSLILPVQHKETPIAYVLLDVKEQRGSSTYNDVQMITTITNVVAVAIENKRLFKLQIEQERLRREMELASEMQLMMVPEVLPTDERLNLASIYLPQLGIGGDYYDCIELGDDKMLFCVGDISGKGIAAALLMSNFQSALYYCVNKMEDMKSLVEELNTAIFRITQGNRFLTLFIGLYDMSTKRLEYVNAGHQPPFWIQNGEITELRKGSTILGSFEQLMKIEVGIVETVEASMLLIYTDGLTDLQNENGQYLSEQLLKDFALNNQFLDVTAFNNLLLERITLFKGAAAFPDDLTILSCKFK